MCPLTRPNPSPSVAARELGEIGRGPCQLAPPDEELSKSALMALLRFVNPLTPAPPPSMATVGTSPSWLRAVDRRALVAGGERADLEAPRRRAYLPDLRLSPQSPVIVRLDGATWHSSR
jgi:hypothetical protein